LFQPVDGLVADLVDGVDDVVDEGLASQVQDHVSEVSISPSGKVSLVESFGERFKEVGCARGSMTGQGQTYDWGVAQVLCEQSCGGVGESAHCCDPASTAASLWFFSGCVKVLQKLTSSRSQEVYCALPLFTRDCRSPR
jgi:hypothetical protein